MIKRTGTIDIGKDDLIVWKGQHYKLAGRKDGITYLRNINFPDVTQPFTRAELADMWKHSSQFEYHKDHFAIGGPKRVEVAGPTLTTLRKKALGATLRNLEFVKMFITAHAQGKYKRTCPSAAQAAKDFQPIIDGLGKLDEGKKTLTSEHSPKPRKTRVGKTKEMAPVVVDGELIGPGFEPPCGETLLRHVWKFEESFGDPMSLRPKYENCGYYGSHVAPEVEAIVTSCMSEWLTRERLGPEAILKSVNSKIDEYNDLRDEAEGDRKLSYPSLNTIIHATNQIDPYYASLCRDGEAIAELKFGWTKETQEIKAPGQRVEMDAYKVDLMTLMCWSGAWEGLNRQERRALKRKRMWLTIAIDKATRCVLAMRLSKSADAPNAVATLAMIESDKTVYSDAAETETPWDMRTGAMTLVVDGGYVSDEVRAAMADARGTVEYPEAGDAKMRGTIERIFRTVASQLIARLRGRTFSNIIERGDYESTDRAGITIDELAWILVTWVVDIYHNTPHEGLNGKTPRMAWKDAVDMFDVRPWRDAHGRRTAYGVRLTDRSLTSEGFEVMGNTYRDYSEDGAMGKRLHSHQKKFTVLVDVTNLGAISFIDGDRAYSVPCTDPTMEGVHAAEWMAATKQVRTENANRTSLPRAVAHRALKRIQDLNARPAAGPPSSIRFIAPPTLYTSRNSISGVRSATQGPGQRNARA